MILYLFNLLYNDSVGYDLLYQRASSIHQRIGTYTMMGSQGAMDPYTVCKGINRWSGLYTVPTWSIASQKAAREFHQEYWVNL